MSARDSGLAETDEPPETEGDQRLQLCWEYLRRRADYAQARASLVAGCGRDGEEIVSGRSVATPPEHVRSAFKDWGVACMPDPAIGRPIPLGAFDAGAARAYFEPYWLLREPEIEQWPREIARAKSWLWGAPIVAVVLNLNLPPDELAEHVRRLAIRERELRAVESERVSANPFARLGGDPPFWLLEQAERSQRLGKRSRTTVNEHRQRIRAWDLKCVARSSHQDIHRALWPSEHYRGFKLEKAQDATVRKLLRAARAIIAGPRAARPWLAPLR